MNEKEDIVGFSLWVGEVVNSIRVLDKNIKGSIIV